MDDFFQTPTAQDAPAAKATTPWTLWINYRSGKAGEAFAADATPEQVKAGFSYKDKETGEYPRLENFSCSIVAMVAEVSGQVELKSGTKVRYWSNPVFDTRDQVFNVMKEASEGPAFSGIYDSFKPDLPNGVKYGKKLIVWVYELQTLASLDLTMTLETALVDAIAASTKVDERGKKGLIFNLCQISTKFWSFKFTGEFTKKTKDGGGWNGKGEMFFAPVLSVGVATSDNPKAAHLPGCATLVTEYVNAIQDRVWNATPAETVRKKQYSPANDIRAQSQNAAMENPFPENAPPDNSDDLPF